MKERVKKELLIYHYLCRVLFSVVLIESALLITGYLTATSIPGKSILKTDVIALPITLALLITIYYLQRHKYNFLVTDILKQNKSLDAGFHSLFNAVPASLVFAKTDGTIEDVNKNWKAFADENSFKSSSYGIGENYFSVAGRNSKLTKGLQNLSEDKCDRFSMIYPCHSPEKKRWFRLIAVKEQHVENPRLLLMHIDITDLYVSKDLAQRLQYNMQQVIDLVPHLIFARDSNGNFTFVNKRFAELYGYESPAVLKNKNVKDCAPQNADAQKFLAQDAVVLSTQQVKIFPEDTFTDKNGNTHIFHTSKVCYMAADTHKQGVLGVAIEITEQKKAERALKKAEANYREIFEKANEGILIFDIASGKIMNANKKACDITGFTSHELLHATPETIALLSPCSLRTTVYRQPAGMVKEYNTVEWQLTKKSNATVWIEVSCTMATIAGVERIISFFHEIEDRKHAEDAMKKSEAELRSLFAAMNDLVVVLGVNGDCLSVAPTSYFGQVNNAKNFIGKNLAMLLPYDEATKILGHVATAIQEQRTISFEYKLAEDDGDIWMEATISPLGDQSVFWISRNITARKFAELEHCRISQDLVQKIKDLEQFAYIVSHNLRAPVANILGITNALHAMQLNAEKREQLKLDQLTCVKRLDEVIKDLNYILQIKSEVTEQKETVHFSQLVASVQQCIDYLIRKENVVFITDFSGVDEIKTFKSYLYSIFFNLISNSIKYRQPHVKPVIEIAAVKTNGKIKLIFKDNGLGIDLSKNQQQVFGLYKRFHTHTDGKGVGLYMTKTQVETLGGKISVASAENCGTTFTIEFDQ